MTAKRFFALVLAGTLIFSTSIPMAAVSEGGNVPQQTLIIETEIAEDLLQEQSNIDVSSKKSTPPSALSVGNSTTPPAISTTPPAISTTPPAISNESGFPVATATIVTVGENPEDITPGLYITIENVPSNLYAVDVEYSFGGMSYALWDYKSFEDIGKLIDENGKLTLLCYGVDEHPLIAYLTETVSNLHLRVSCYFPMEEDGGDYPNFQNSAKGTDNISQDNSDNLRRRTNNSRDNSDNIGGTDNILPDNSDSDVGTENPEYPEYPEYPEFPWDYYYIELEPIYISNGKTYEIPATPPPFSAYFKMDWFNYYLMGNFTDFPPNVAKICNTYSWDGVNYEYTNPPYPTQWDLMWLGNPAENAKKRLEEQDVAQSYQEPLLSYFSGEKNDFYFRLEITTENNEVYYSQPSYISRPNRQPMPTNLTPIAYLGFDVARGESRDSDGNIVECIDNENEEVIDTFFYTHGEYQLTVRDDITPAELMALLPDTIPVDIKLWDNITREKYAVGKVQCKVEWKTLPNLSLTSGVPFVIEDFAKPLVIPANTEIVTELGTYTLNNPLKFNNTHHSDDIKLILNPVSKDDEPRAALYGYLLDMDSEGNDRRDDEPISLAFWNKPSGATSIKTYLTVGNERTEICDLLERRNLNYNQSNELYGYVDLFKYDEYPFANYISGELEGFTIDFEIVGGAYDGKKAALSWPKLYDRPEQIFDPYGFDGQELNAGSDLDYIVDIDDGGDGGSDGGQRPNLPGGGDNSDGDYDYPDSGTKPQKPPKQPNVLEIPNADKIPQVIANPVLPITPPTETPINPITDGTLQDNSSGDNSDTDTKNDGDIVMWNPDRPDGAIPVSEFLESADDQSPQRADNEKSIPVPIMVAGILLAGGGVVALGIAAVSSGTAGGAAATGIVSKLIAAIKGFFIH